MMEQRRLDLERKAKARTEEEAKEKGKGESSQAMEQDEDDQETTPVPPPVVDEDEDEDEDEDDDIEASIEKELAALKSGRGGSQAKVKKDGNGGDKGKGKAKERPRFMNIETGTECRKLNSSLCTRQRAKLIFSVGVSMCSLFRRYCMALRSRRISRSDSFRGTRNWTISNAVRFFLFPLPFPLLTPPFAMLDTFNDSRRQ